jgi:uracil-DNA glycosylase
MNINIEIDSLNSEWSPILQELIEPYNTKIDTFLNQKYENNHHIIPDRSQIFNAFRYCPISELKVVIIGQDCYYSRAKNGSMLANGLCFSVSQECNKCPPSLKTIFDELYYEYGERRTNTDLSDWAMQGVLLLNCALTVREGKAGSHMKIWKGFTEDIIKYITKEYHNVVYILWGEFAKSYAKYIDKNNNFILECRHPSGLAASKGPFVGNNHFKLTNKFLEEHGKEPIKWL